MSWEVREGDCVEAMRAMPEASVDSIVCDPPYGLEFMGKEWDNFKTGRAAAYSSGGNLNETKSVTPPGGTNLPIGPNYTSRPAKRCGKCGKQAWSGSPCQCEQPEWIMDNSTLHTYQAWCEAWAHEALRVLKPGGHLLAFGGTRTYHRLACAIEDAGFEIRDCLAWLYGSGFSKSWNFKTMYPEDGWCSCDNAFPYDHEEAEHGMRDVRDGDVPPAEGTSGGPGPVLQPSVPEPSASTHGTASGQSRDDRGAEPGMEGWDLHRTGEGLQARQAPGSPASETQRLRAGAHPRGGTDARSIVENGRGGPSPESRPSGQPSGESPGLQQPQRALDDGALRNGGGCPRCGKLLPFFKAHGSGLKPAHEPVVMARKPLSGTLAATVLEHGTGALNVDGCRVETDDNLGGGAYSKGAKKREDGWVTQRAGDENAMRNGAAGEFEQPTGRWPANVLLDEQAAEMLDEQTGELTSGEPGIKRGGNNGAAYGAESRPPGTRMGGFGDSGGASRFLYCAKSSAGERNAGLDGFEEQSARWGGTIQDGRPHMAEGYKYEAKRANVHPTVKPIELMRWLVRLVTPPGGTVLDPFTGSGTTGCAAVLERLNFIGIEREAEYVAIARARVGWWEQHPEGLEIVKSLEADRVRRAVADSGQLGLLG